MKVNLKEVVEVVRNACFNGEKIKGIELNKKYGVSQKLLPVMIRAGYIQKLKGFQYKWKVQAEILPVMLKKIQDDITAENMKNVNKQRKKEITGREEFNPPRTSFKFPNNEPAPKIEIERPENNEKLNELMSRLDTLLQLNKQDRKIKELEELNSKNNSRKFVIRLFGLPIFAISRS